MNPVRRLRTIAQLSQQNFAAKACTSQPAIAAYESGAKSPRLATLDRLASSVGLTVAVRFTPPMTREDTRSLALHDAICAKLLEDPETLLSRARRTLGKMRRARAGGEALIREWERWLALPLAELVEQTLDPGLHARDMRQVTPFAGVLSARERATTLKSFRSERER